MASPPNEAPSHRRPPTAAASIAFRAANCSFVPPSSRLVLLLALFAVVALHLTDPAAWGRLPGLWAPTAGLGLVLVAWFGPRAGLLLLASGVLTILQSLVFGAWSTGGLDSGGLALPASDALLGIGEVLAAWQLYRRLGGGRALADPRSALLFVLIVPGLTAAVFALTRTVAAAAITSDWTDLSQRLLSFWLSRSLGLLTVAPPLLTVATPWLVGRGLVRPETANGQESAQALHAGADPLTRGDAVEIAGLAFGAALLALLLTFTYGRQQFEGWQPWGAALLLVVWASLRQGQRGGVLTAAAGAALPLSVLALFPGLPPRYAVLIQGNLLALCGAGLLAAAAAGWVRLSELRYRQVVTHVPVVVYSGRIFPTDGGRHAAEVTLVSAASESLLGCPPEALLGDHQRWLARVHPDDHEVVRAALAQLARQNMPVTCEYRLAPPRPLVPATDAPAPIRQPTPLPARWVRDVLAPHFDAAGRLTGWEGVVTDITEQRALAVDLRRTTGMFHALVANLPAGVFFVQGPAGQPILVNNRARELLGRREDPSAGLEHLSDTYRLFRSDGSPYPVEELPVVRALREGVASMCDDIVVHRPDGRRVPLVTWGAPVRLGGHGQADAAVWVLEDLTALHQAEAARRDTEGRLRTVVETMGEGLVVQDRKGVVVDGNPAACAVFQRSLEGLRGSSLFTFWSYLSEDGASLPEEEHPVQVVLRTGRPVRNVVLGLLPAAAVGNPDGPEALLSAPRWFLVNAMPLAGGAATAGVVTTFSDVTAYRRAQEVLRVSEEKYRGLVESLPLMVVQCDRAMRLQYANPAVRSISGFELDEVSDPAAWASIIVPEDLPTVRAMIGDALAGTLGRLEWRYHAKDKSLKTVFGLAQPRWHDGAIVGVTMLMVDMTRERQLEQDLQRSQRLELIGRLSCGIAHDFNNLLTVVLSLTDLAHGSLPPEHPVHGDLRRITEAGEQAASLAGQLLSFSKQRATGRRAEVNRAARRTLDLLRGALPSAVRIEMALENGELCVAIDETQLQQVLMNLCLNARDAMPNGGALRVRTELVAAPGDSGGAPWVCLSVADEGCGMADEIKARIFDPFFSTKERGTGLGLAVVRQIVEGSGGHVEVGSAPDRGSRFDVWLPTKAPAVVPDAAAEAAAHIAQGI